MLKHFKSVIWIAVLFYCLSFSAKFVAQSACENANFESGTFLNWRGETGTYNGTGNNGLITSNTSPATNGIVNGRHTIMTGAGTDPNVTCGNLTVVAPGSTFSARLGDQLTGADLGFNTLNNTRGGAERLMYNFSITPQSSLIIYKYAVVIENPDNHTEDEMPRFLASLSDQNGNIIECTNYEVYASTGNEGFTSCGSVTYSDWKTVGVDVSSYVGQTLTLKFATADCSQSGHYGYAYVDAGCAPFALDTRYCLNVGGQQSAVIEAPEGFDSYLWTSNNQTLGTQSSVIINNPTQGQVVSCQITSFNGCVANLQASLTPSDVDASFTSQTACTGESSNIVNTTTFVNSVLDSIHWSSSDGFTSTSTTFDHIFTSPGNYSVTMFVQSDAGCTDQVTQQVVVNPIPNPNFNLTNVCLGQTTTLNAQSSISSGSLINTWIINEIDTLIGNQFNYDFTTIDTFNVELIASAVNSNCADTLEQQIIVFGNPQANFQITEKCIDQSVEFVNNSQYFSNTSFDWEYNNNVISTDTNFTQVFSIPGINTISLIITEAHPEVSCADTNTQSFMVHAYPDILLSNPPDPCVSELSTLFIDNATTVVTGENINYFWTVNGTVYSTNPDLIYNVPGNGTYTITMNAATEFGCSIDSTFIIDLYQDPVADFTFIEQCSNIPVSFTSISTFSENPYYYWIYNNNIVSNENSYSSVFTTPGVNSITLIITDEHHGIYCDDTLTQSFFVHDFPDLDFSNTAQPCEGNPITSFNLSTISSGEQINYLWSINGTPVSTFFDLTYTFPNDGIYNIDLTGTTDFGCISDTNFVIQVYPIPAPPVLSATSPLCPGDEITFSASAESNSSIQWSGPNGFESQNFVVTMPFDMEDLGVYSAFITSQYGCVSPPSFVPTNIINIYDFNQFEFPNVITANNDGINDVLDLNSHFKTCDEYTLYIFNRWGNLVFEQSKNSAQFRGETENNNELNEGVYFYKMVINAIDGKEQIKSGFIHIVK
jgi:gliding motility-associated-like protein